MVSYEQIISELRKMANPENVKGMEKFGISTKNALGVSVTELRKMAKDIRSNHILAEKLWASEIHEARILAAMVEEPDKVSENQIERWVNDFDSWDVCDQCCSNLFDKTKWAYQKAFEWSSRDKEFVKRAGYVMMAVLAVHDKEAEDKKFIPFFRLIKKGANDERNFVKKAVNWALRQIGKRNIVLNAQAIAVAKEIASLDSDSAKWIAADAIRELESIPVEARLKGASGK